MNIENTKYTRDEYERRFLVGQHSDWKDFVASYSKTFEDKYLRDSRLRLRRLTDSDTGRRLFKLTKKFESASPFFRKLTTILLSQTEYELLDKLEGDQIKKIRYYHNFNGRIFSIDVFEGELEELILCETEAEGIQELMWAEPPSYVKYEVSEDPFFTGGVLSRTTRAELLSKLSAYE